MLEEAWYCSENGCNDVYLGEKHIAASLYPSIHPELLQYHWQNSIVFFLHLGIFAVIAKKSPLLVGQETGGSVFINHKAYVPFRFVNNRH